MEMGKTEDTNFFLLARQLVESEDQLVDNRVGWVLTFNGFLLAAYMATYLIELQNTIHPFCCIFEEAYRQELTISQETMAGRIYLLRQLITFVGGVSGILALIGITAAFRAIHNVKILLNIKITSFKEESRYDVPFSVTADNFSNFLGMLSPLLLCNLVFGTWLVFHFQTFRVLSDWHLLFNLLLLFFLFPFFCLPLIYCRHGNKIVDNHITTGLEKDEEKGQYEKPPDNQLQTDTEKVSAES